MIDTNMWWVVMKSGSLTFCALIITSCLEPPISSPGYSQNRLGLVASLQRLGQEALLSSDLSQHHSETLPLKNICVPVAHAYNPSYLGG
jgi:hypothetical protein